MRVLAGGVEREDALAGLVIADRSARLHRIRHQPVVDDVEPGHMRGLGEGSVRRRLVAEMPVEDRVVRRLLMHDRRCTRRPRRVHHRGQYAVIDGDRFGRVARLGERLRHDHRDMVADIADLALGQRRMGAGPHRRTVLVVDHPAADQPADLVRREIRAGEDADDAGHGGRRLGVDAAQLGMGIRGAQEIGIGLSRPVDVVCIAPAPGDEAMVFLAPNGRSDGCDGHAVSSLHGAT